MGRERRNFARLRTEVLTDSKGARILEPANWCGSAKVEQTAQYGLRQSAFGSGSSGGFSPSWVEPPPGGRPGRILAKGRRG